MVTIGPRTYRLDPSELPVSVTITAVKLAANRAIVGDLRISTNGTLVCQVRPIVTGDPAALVKRYEILAPDGQAAPYDISQTIDGWFDDTAPDDAKYHVVITATGGDGASTSMRVPTINPNAANLAFQVR